VAALKNIEELTFSKLFENIDYVVLEQTPKSLVTADPYLALTDDYIIAKNQAREMSLLVFDRKTGKFIREIGTKGRGPHEYAYIPHDFYDSKKKIIYTLGNNDNVITFNLNGEYSGEIRPPNIFTVDGRSPFSSGSFDTFLDSSTYVSYVANVLGNEKKKMVLFSKDSLLKVFPNYLSWKRTPSNNFFVLSPETMFFRYKNKLCFKEEFNDTLFEVRRDVLLPRIVFNSGAYTIPYQEQENYLSTGKWQKCIIIDQFNENPDYLFFTFQLGPKTYVAFYNKETQITKVCTGTDSFPSALNDDMNNFLPVVKFKITDSNELICSFEALAAKKWLDSNPEKAKALIEKFPCFKNLTDSDNPVVMIAKCKD
jgi:hypothetical protein